MKLVMIGINKKTRDRLKEFCRREGYIIGRLTEKIITSYLDSKEKEGGGEWKKKQ